MERRVATEWLDELPVTDAGASGSRRDLERLNAWMGNRRLVVEQLRRLYPNGGPPAITEMGAGDGKFMLGVARRLSREWRGIRVRLVDRQPAALSQVADDFAGLGWQPELARGDVFDLVREPTAEYWGATVANLFLHHFSEAQLAELFGELSRRAGTLIAVEPRRSSFALAASHLVRFIGCNRVTRHDAPVSVRAGFAGRELSALWVDHRNWRLQEGRAGLFSHLFVARRFQATR